MMKKGLAVIMAAAILCQGVSAEETPDNSLGKEAIEEALDLANIIPEWTYSEENDAWTMEPVTAVANAELPDYQGVSVCVPGAYVIGVDTDGDGTADETSGTAKGNLVIDYEAEVTSTNGQVYSAASSPVIINTGAAGYSAQENQTEYDDGFRRKYGLYGRRAVLSGGSEECGTLCEIQHPARQPSG